MTKNFLLERLYFVPQKLWMKMGKDMKIKPSVSAHSPPRPPTKVWGNFFLKKFLHEVNTPLWANLWGDGLHED